MNPTLFQPRRIDVFDYDAIVLAFKNRVLADGGTYTNETALRAFLPSLDPNTTLALYPSSYKAGKIYSVLPNTSGGDATVTRATTKTRINSSGILESVAVNTLAPDYTTGSGRILIEQQRTNFYSTSENFASGWTKSSLSTTANTSISPYGTMTASTVKETVDASVIQHRMFRSLAVTSGKNYTFSIFARARDRNFIRMQPSAGFNNAYANFDLVNGAVGLNDGGNPRIYSLANGLKRIAITVTANTTGNVFPSAFITIDGDNVSQNYIGTGLDCYDIFGAMVVEGEEMGSYIPSLGSMVTRNADIVTITPPALTSKITTELDNGTITEITTIPASYQLPNGRYKSIKMTK